MGFLKRLFGGATETSPDDGMVTLPHHVYYVLGELRVRGEWFDTRGAGDPMFSHGYALLGPRGGQHGVWDELMPAKWQSAGLQCVLVAGVTYKPRSLQSTDYLPSRRVSLVPEPNNPHDAHAVGVWNASRTDQLGYLPKDVASVVHLTHPTSDAFVLREHRDRRTNARLGVKIVFAPGLQMDVPED